MKRHRDRVGPIFNSSQVSQYPETLISRGWESTVSPKVLILSSNSRIGEGAEVTQKYKNAESNRYATSSDFCHIYVEQMNSLYLLSLLLAAGPQKAEQCFLIRV
jgi:hypothetical protein